MLIEVKNLRRVFCTDKVKTVALRDVSFNFKKGEFMAIRGPSGSGKSTLLHILGFLDKPSAGQYYFDGHNVENYSVDEIARFRNEKIGFVFQSFNLLARTSVYENVKLPLLYSRVPESKWDELVKSAIESVGLSHRREHNSSQLSGGEKQRVAIARALVTAPDVIFADEPTGNLDSKSGRMVMEILRQLNEEKGHSVILITHETYTARYAERVIHLKDGEINAIEQIDGEHRVKNGLIK